MFGGLELPTDDAPLRDLPLGELSPLPKAIATLQPLVGDISAGEDDGMLMLQQLLGCGADDGDHDASRDGVVGMDTDARDVGGGAVGAAEDGETALNRLGGCQFGQKLIDAGFAHALHSSFLF